MFKGMIYLNVEDLGWRPFITSWMALKKEQVRAEISLLRCPYLLDPVMSI